MKNENKAAAPAPAGGHTPGPWIASGTKSMFGTWGVFTKAGMYSVLDATAPHGRAAANARLCASAPALLGALRGLLALETRYTGVGLKEFDAARAAIAQTGGDK